MKTIDFFEVFERTKTNGSKFILKFFLKIKTDSSSKIQRTA